MSVPVRRQTHGKTRLRRAHHSLKKLALSVCSKCKKAVQPHHACGFCGTYSGKQVISTARTSERALRRSASNKVAEETKPAKDPAKQEKK
ncbi:MAG: 50S ribosomal protein L32 [Candidatus Uhrbacteria bacterium]